MVRVVIHDVGNAYVIVLYNGSKYRIPIDVVTFGEYPGVGGYAYVYPKELTRGRIIH